jgi:hypothetical protein
MSVDRRGAGLCSRSCQHGQGYPERIGAGEGRGRQVTAPLRCRGSGEEGRGPSSQTVAGEP